MPWRHRHRAVEQQPGRVDLGRHVGELPLDALQVDQAFAGVRPFARVLDGVLQRTLRRTDAHRGVAAAFVVEVREQGAE